jgi:hypothetical protein
MASAAASTLSTHAGAEDRTTELWGEIIAGCDP